MRHLDWNKTFGLNSYNANRRIWGYAAGGHSVRTMMDDDAFDISYTAGSIRPVFRHTYDVEPLDFSYNNSRFAMFP